KPGSQIWALSRTPADRTNQKSKQFRRWKDRARRQGLHQSAATDTLNDNPVAFHVAVSTKSCNHCGNRVLRKRSAEVRRPGRIAIARLGNRNGQVPAIGELVEHAPI